MCPPMRAHLENDMDAPSYGATRQGVVYLNVGGVYFGTTWTTMAAAGGFFEALSDYAPAAAEDGGAGSVFIDRDPTHFRDILNWMRGVGHLPTEHETLEELWWEADYYCLADLKQAIVTTRQRYCRGQQLQAIQHELRRGCG